MTDKEKLDAVRAEIHRLVDVRGYDREMANDLFTFMDSLPNEPVSGDFEMALAEMVDKAQKCIVEPLVVAEQWKDELIKLAKSEEPVSESIDFEQELYKAFGQIKDFTLGIAIAKRFYDIGRKHNEPVSKDLNEAAEGYAVTDEVFPNGKVMINFQVEKAFLAGAKWQKQHSKCPLDCPAFSDGYKIGMKEAKQQMMKDATEVIVAVDAGGYPYVDKHIELYDYDKDVPLAKEGDKYKVVLIKEDCKEEPISEPNKELAETYLAVFDKKFPILPSLSGKQLADYKDFLNKCQQIFGLKEWGTHPIQSKLFEKLTLLWAVWGAEHLQGVGRQDEKEQDIPVSEELEDSCDLLISE